MNKEKMWELFDVDDNQQFLVLASSEEEAKRKWRETRDEEDRDHEVTCVVQVSFKDGVAEIGPAQR